MLTNKQITQEKEKVEFDMSVSEGNAKMRFDLNKYATYASTDDLALFEWSQFETRLPDCRLRWRVRYFKDFFQKPEEHSISLQLVSCQLERDTAIWSEVSKIGGECELFIGNWYMRPELRHEFDLDKPESAFPITKSVTIDRWEVEKQLQRVKCNQSLRLRVAVRANFRPKNLVIRHSIDDFTSSSPASQIAEEEEEVSLLENFVIFDKITARTYKFEKFAKYASSEALSLLQSGEFVTSFSDCQLTWRVRYFRDRFQKPLRHSVSLQLLSRVLDKKRQLQARVTCQLRIGGSRWKMLVADFDLTAEQELPIIESADLDDGDDVEDLLSATVKELRVGLVVYVRAYTQTRCIGF